MKFTLSKSILRIIFSLSFIVSIVSCQKDDNQLNQKQINKAMIADAIYDYL